MATAAARARNDLGPDWRDKLRASVRRFALRSIGAALLALSAAGAVALATHNSTDASFTTAAGGQPVNWLGSFGAYLSDLLLLLFGLGSIVFLPVIALAGLRLLRTESPGRMRRGLLVATAAAVLIGLALGLASSSAVAGLPSGWGGALGLAGAAGVNAAIGLIPDQQFAAPVRIAVLILFAAAGLVVAFLSLGLTQDEKDGLAGLFRRRPREQAAVPRKTETARDEAGAIAAPPRSRPSVSVVEPTKPANRSGGAARRTAAQQTLALGDDYVLPDIGLLAPVVEKGRMQIDRAALERNARILESVLEDFHVRGDIVEVRPGPVVTMYELEPASGIKASRVIQLADDIARNMQAISARVAIIPGRSVIGIELPNPKREGVVLSELVQADAFADATMSLPLILGKNIAGDPVIADLAPMPHLLVAGTTGSGKSVGLNCMIVSLLYRLNPEQCRLIMIDPKMLELSTYEGIPHLLAPVVTEPGKAIRALKWTVEQMEERYRMMANLGVRALPSFNAKVREAKAKGTQLGRQVQTGYNADTGQPIYEVEQLEYEVLPQIVVVVDELADLMMTAGKEVEFLIQRLAQKARAAGIHLIMA
ncbi:MAG: DNA translocase FtsK 4TM domain-containing protein, partial [Sphingomonas sp.]|nr:DNA translocase FtsK 4TM domain-containing protein [Sphingomonas sp.]